MSKVLSEVPLTVMRSKIQNSEKDLIQKHYQGNFTSSTIGKQILE